MSRKPHQIVQNDVRFSGLPEHSVPIDEGLANSRIKSDLEAVPRRGLLSSSKLARARDVVGLYRIPGEAQRPNDVRVISGNCSLFMTEAEYRQRECQPLFADLPWRSGPDVKPTRGTS